MLDIKLIRSNPEKVINALARRGGSYNLDEFLKIDKKRRELIAETEALKARQNSVSKSIPALKKEGKDVTGIFAEMKELSEKVKCLDDEIRNLDAEIEKVVLSLPNLPHDNVKTGKSDEDNEEIRKFGTPGEFDFEPKAHWDIGEQLGILDWATAAKVTGTRFTFYRVTAPHWSARLLIFIWIRIRKTVIKRFSRPIWYIEIPCRGRASFPNLKRTPLKSAEPTISLSPLRRSGYKYAPRRDFTGRLPADKILRIFRLFPRRSRLGWA